MVLSFFMGEFPRIRRGALPVRRSSVPPCDITGIGPCRSGPWPRAFCRGGLREALGHGPLLQGASGLWRAVAAQAARRAREHHRTPIGSATCRDRVWQDVSISVVAAALNTKLTIQSKRK